MINSKKYFDFEKKNNLFDLLDNNGTPVWDLVRQYCYHEILEKDASDELYQSKSLRPPVKRRHQYFKTLFKVIVNDVMFYFSSFKKNDYFCYLNARNLIKGEYIDQNQFDAIKLLDLSNSVAIETTGRRECYKKHKMFRGVYRLPIILPRIISSKHYYYDFSNIINLIEHTFGNQKFNAESLLAEYRAFYKDYVFYKWYFKKTQIKGVFITLNCQQKGMMAACKSLGIPTYEFQHGIVNHEHMVYSYPNINLNNKIIAPNILFSLSSHWFKNFNYPSKVVPIGNSYFYGERETSQDEKSILVISNYRDGMLLKDFLIKCLEDDYWANFKFYFKLHPEQFFQYDYYSELFQKYKNITVVSNQLNVPQLLNKCASMFLIQSTSSYEALQRGAKVYLYKRIDFYQQDDIFDDSNVYLIDNPEEFKNNIEKPYIETCNNYFMPFSSLRFLQTIEQCEKS